MDGATRRKIRRAFGAQALEIVERHDRPAVIEKFVMRAVAPLELQILQLQGGYRRWWWVLTGRR